MESVTVECNASGYKMTINDAILAEYRERGWDLPEDYGKGIEEVTWVNGDYHKKVEDAEWPEHLPYWSDSL